MWGVTTDARRAVQRLEDARLASPSALGHPIPCKSCSMRTHLPATLAMGVLLAGCATGKHRREAAPIRADERACLVLLEHWGREAEKVRPSIGQISDRSRLFGPDIRRLQGVFALMTQTQQEAINLATEAKRLKGSAREGRRTAAVARLEALWLALPIVTLRLNYLLLASHGEDAGVLSTHWTDMLVELDRRTGPVLEAMRGFDGKHMAAVAAAHREDLIELQAALPRFEKAVAQGADWSRRSVRIADGVTLAMSAYEVYTAARGDRKSVV